MEANTRLRVKEIRDRADVRGAFLVRTKTLRQARNGKAYLTMELADRTGSIEARVWDDAERLDAMCDVGAVVEVVARATSYQGRLQLNVDNMQPLPPEAITLEDFLPQSAYDLDALFAALREVVEGVSDPWTRLLLLSFFDDPEFAPRLRVAPAAKFMHHAYLGGLVEHALSMSRVADGLYQHYERVYPGMLDRDLLLAGAILHDLGKVLEIGADAAFDYTDEGRLVGHIVQGVELITEKARAIEGFPAERLAQIKHLVVAHHGKLEYGSPRTPCMAEALLLHFVDMIDARMNAVHTATRDEAGKPWTRYSRMLEAALLNPYGAVPVDEEGSPILPEREPDWLANRPAPAGPAPVAAPAVDEAPPRRKRSAPEQEADEDAPQNLPLF